MNDGNTNKKHRVGFWMNYSAITNQQIDLMQQMSIYAGIETVALIPDAEFIVHKDWFVEQLHGLNRKTYKPDDQALLSGFDIVIFPESNHDVYGEFPDSIIKIGCPHGVDIPLDKTVNTYGGGFIFDYVLSSKQQTDYPLNYFVDKFPTPLRNHSRPYLCEIPFGMPKLDRFLHSVDQHHRRSSRRAIIYHISYLDIESDWVPSLLLPTLSSLLQRFSDYDVVFRPYHLDRQHPQIIECIEYGQNFSNFIYSDADSYVEDYARGDVMVCHRAYQQHLFSLATGAYTVLCSPHGVAINFEHVEISAFIRCTPDSLYESVLMALRSKHSASSERRMMLCREAGIYHPGTSVAYLMQQLPYLIENRRHPEWKYYPLDSDSPLTLRTTLSLNLISMRPANMFYVAMASRMPSYLPALLFAADSYSRVNGLNFYYYRHSLRFFYELLQSVKIDIGLMDIIHRWWVWKGYSCLDFMLAKASILNFPIDEEILRLQDDCKQFTEIDKPEQVEILFNVSTLKPVSSAKRLVLYGAGKIADDFISTCSSSNFELLDIIDSDVNKHGLLFHGYEIKSVDMLNELQDEVNVLICSREFLLDIYMSLRKKFPAIKNIYAIMPDAITLMMLCCVNEGLSSDLELLCEQVGK